MKFSKSAQREGGKAPASQKQKATARTWIVSHQPWKRSTGPRTSLGRCVSSQNALRHGLYRSIRLLPLVELKEIWRDPFYRQVARRLCRVQAQRDRESVAFKQWLKEFLLPEFLRRTNGQ